MSKTANKFVLFAFALCCFLILPALAGAQTAFWQTDTSKIDFLSPQTNNRPDILWMRGGHQSEVSDIKFSPDGQKLVTSALEGTVKVFRASDGILLRTFTRPDGSPFLNSTTIEVSPDNQRLAIGDVIMSPSNAIVVYIYNINDGTWQRTISGFTSVGSFFSPYLSFAPDGNSLLVNKDIVSMVSGMIERTIPATINGQSPTIGVSYSPSGGRIMVIAGQDGYEIDSTSFSFIRAVNSGTHYSPNGLYAFSGAFVKRLSDLSQITLTNPGLANREFSAAFSPNGQYFAVSYGYFDETRPSSVKVWNVSNSSTTWSLAYQFQPEAGGVLVLFTPDSQYLATSGLVTSFWNASNGTFARGIGTLSLGETHSLSFSSDGQALATVTRGGNADNQYGKLQLWNVADGTRRNVNFSQSNSLSNLFDVGFADNNQKIITTETFNVSDNYIKVWNAADGSLIRNTQITINCGASSAVAVAPHQQTFAAGGCPPTIYNVSDGSVIRTIGSGSPVSYSPDGQILATISFENIFLWNVTDGSLIQTLSGSTDEYVASESGAAFSPDGQTMAVIYRARNAGGPNSHIKLFRVSDGAVLQDFGTFNSIFGGSVAFSPDGNTVIGTGYDATVRIWRVSDGTLLQTYDQETNSGIQSRLFQVAYSPDGSRFAYGRFDATVVMARNPYNAGGTTNYTISGHIQRSNNAAVSGVAVALSGSTSNNTTTNANGDYSFTVAEGGSYTVTPSLAGNSFTPTNQTFNFISQNQTANFTAALNTFTISGNVQADGANLAGATVSLSGSQSATATTDANGNYSFNANQGGNYTVTVSKNGFVFNPASQTVTNLQTNTVVNFQSSANAPLCFPASSGLVAWYKGENDAADSSGNNNNGELNGGVGFTAGRVGQALSFDGIDDRVVIPDSSSTRPTNALTIDVWAKPVQVNQYVQFVTKFDSTNSQKTYYFGTDVTGGKIQFAVYNSAGNVRRLITDSNILTANVLTHLTAVFDASTQTMKIYVNGAEVPASLIESNTVSTFFNGSSPTFLGTRVEASSYVEFFKGLLDEVQIYNRALSATEIQNIYNAGSAGVCQSFNPTVWLKAEGNTNDSSGNGDHAATQNGVSFTAGRVGQAFSLNGTNQALRINQVSNNLNYGAGDFAISAWVKFTVTGIERILYGSAYQGSDAVAIYLTTNSRAEFFARDGSNNAVDIVGTTALNDNNWHYIVGMRNGKTGLLYVDGVLQNSQTNNSLGTINAACGFDWIGGYNSSTGCAAPATGYFYSGLLDEFQIYRRALSAAEIQTQYQLGSAGASQGSTYTPPSANGKIAFHSSRKGNYEIFTMNADGSGQMNISNNSATDINGEWSPNGSKIAFVSFRNGTYDIYTMDADGSNQTRLTTTVAYEDTPSWSPDGTRIVFASDRDGNYEIYVMNSDGTNQTRLTNSLGDDYFPKFSPDGSRIAFYTNRTGGDIYIMNADGTNPINLTNNVSFDFDPNWSPDGSKIAFRSDRSGDADVWVMNASGTNPVNLSNNLAGDFSPTFSPDGNKIAFTSDRNGNNEIYVMNAADGTNQIRLTTAGNDDAYPSWQRTSASVSVAPVSNFNVTFSNVTQSGNSVATPLTQAQMPALPSGLNLFSGALVYDIRTSAAYSGNITVTENVPNVVSSAVCSNLRLYHFENGAWTPNTNAAPVYNSTTQVCTVSQTVSSLSPFAVIELAPLAANVSVSGRISTANSVGIRNAVVTLTDANGTIRAARTGAFGYYRFDGVAVGETYVFSVFAKRFNFTEPTRVLTVAGNLSDVNFTAQE